MPSLSSQYNKAVIMALTIIVIVGNQVLATSGLGIPPAATQWISIGVGLAGTFLTLLTSNKNQTTLQPGQVIAPATSVKPEETASIVAVHKA